ncbi:RNA 2',3'-cyclic phosphodiesterase [Planobispora rosea]|uniref:RNA 2',3'-cyclic phosphodiesterase n=1 Tax=Planobispora rosea TaxID=35762 RepID=A0A8J3S8J3_PLARO|nr:RNA 2',3'-cyclic phosphodiesterase [Planobispora rosea]GGS72750.1 RNA 2',3'-cyclic phosphodiesterase [Planobispora rosea]GIH85318.1 RNA 2',3'-cyclic phosphodiesterase [Planobispora rosea]
MRLFVGLLPPRPVLDELARALGPHRAAWPRLRWIDQENWHLTLAFLGEVPEEVLPGLETRLGRAASRYAPMTLAFTGAGAFPSARRARVFWSGLREGGGGGSRDDGTGTRGRSPLVRLAESLAAGARRAGAVQVDESKRFRPHLTLARSREETDVRALVGAFEGFAGSPWEAESVHLVRSHLGAGVRYEPIAEWPLGARTPRGQS